MSRGGARVQPGSPGARDRERALFGATAAWGIYRAPGADAMWSRVDVCRDSEDEIVAKLARGATRYLDASPALDARFRRAVTLP
jgi:hypothetical protein